MTRRLTEPPTPARSLDAEDRPHQARQPAAARRRDAGSRDARRRAGRLCFTDALDALDSERGLWRQPASPPSEARRRLHAALHLAIDEALTERQREAVALYFFEGLSERQIAGRLGLSQQVVHKHIFGDMRGGKAVGGALQKLKKALARAGITP